MIRMSLKKVYEPYFKIGTAVSESNMASLQAKQELKKHYNSITAENDILEFAWESGIGLRGHTLVWHGQTPVWFFNEGYSDEEDAPLVDRETMLARMEGYICGVLQFVQTE